MKKITASILIMTCCVIISGCVMSREKGGNENNSGASSSDETRKLITGTWKITSFRCDNKGNNCQKYPGTQIFQYGKNGELIINNVKRGSYRVTGRTCILDTGTSQYTVNIISIDSSRLLTGENHRTTTEIFIRMK